MTATADIETDATVNGEDAAKAAALDAQITADEQDFAAQRAAKARDDGRTLGAQRRADGTFLPSADKGQRAAQPAADISKEAVAGTAAKPAEAAKAADAAEAPDGAKEKTGAGERGGEGVGTPAGAALEDESKLTPFERAKRREAKAWKTINESKLDLERRSIELTAREQRLAGQRPAGPAGGPAGGAQAKPQSYTPAEYLSYATQFEAKAKKLEAAGDFDGADREMALAKLAREEAARPEVANPKPGTRNPEPEHDQALARNWATLKAEMPELLDPSGTVNKETIALLKANPELLADPAGPYRAVIQAGRKVVRTLEAEAAKVPELNKTVETLQKRVKELEALTSLPGGGGPTSRGGGGEVDFASLPADKREALLKEDLAGMRG